LIHSRPLVRPAAGFRLCQAPFAVSQAAQVSPSDAEKELFCGAFPSVAAARQHWAVLFNPFGIFSVLEFASEKSVCICAHPWLNSFQHLTAGKDSIMQKRKLGKSNLEVSATGPGCMSTFQIRNSEF
jgi:hypothetical protein